MLSARYRKIQGKVVVITGASSGAGRAMAVAFASAGANVILASRSGGGLADAVEECQDVGGQAIAVPTDMRDMTQVQALVSTALQHFERIDIWINNAGILAAGTLEDIPQEVNEGVIRTNLIGYMNGTQAVIPIFKKQGLGTIINNISVGAWFPTPYMAAYCASKFGLKGFFDAIRGELRSYTGIHVCDLYPGFLDTPGMQHAANYTGKRLMPAPPLSDPRAVAQKAMEAAVNPRSKSAVGVFPILMRIAYELFPRISRNTTGFIIESYLQKAGSIEKTPGNVLEPVIYGNGIDGGWREIMQPAVRTRKMLIAGTLLAAGILLLGGRK